MSKHFAAKKLKYAAAATAVLIAVSGVAAEAAPAGKGAGNKKPPKPTTTLAPTTTTKAPAATTIAPTTTVAPTTSVAPTTTAAPTTSTTVRPTTSIVPNTTIPVSTGAKPGASNTGVPAGTALTVVNGDQVFTTSGQVISGLDIRGKVTINGSNITLKNSIVRGPASSGGCVNGAALTVKGTSNIVSDVEVAVAAPTACLDAVQASNAGLIRLNVHGGVDGLKIGSNTRLTGSWVHGMNWFASDPNQGGGPTHNDAVQILSGNGISVVGNNLELTKTNSNAAIQVTQDFGLVSNLIISNNWLNGGGCTLNLSHNGGASLSLNVSGNRFGRDSYFNCPILVSTATTTVGGANVWDDTGLAVPVQRHD